MSLPARKIIKKVGIVTSRTIRKTFVLISSLLAIPLIFLIKQYQRFLSPMLGTSCRFYPTCSTYALQCYQNFGVATGSLLSIKRLCKCHPFHPGGLDEVPAVKDINPNYKEADR